MRTERVPVSASVASDKSCKPRYQSDQSAGKKCGRPIQMQQVQVENTGKHRHLDQEQHLQYRAGHHQSRNSCQQPAERYGDEGAPEA